MFDNTVCSISLINVMINVHVILLVKRAHGITSEVFNPPKGKAFEYASARIV